MSHVHGTGRDLTGDSAPDAGSLGARPATRTEPRDEGRAGRLVAFATTALQARRPLPVRGQPELAAVGAANLEDAPREEGTMFGKRLGIALGSALVILLVAVGIALGATRSPGEPDWKKALDTRSQALDHKYGLGTHTRTAASVPAPGWLTALMARSDALDRAYGLGRHANTTP